MSFRKKSQLFSVAVCIGTLVAAPVYSEEKADWVDRISLDGFIAQGWQSPIEVSGAAFLPSDTAAQSGFQRLRYGIQITGKINDRFSVFAEFAEEPNDFASLTRFGISQDLAWLTYKLGENNEIRIGNIIAYAGSMAFLKFSDGAVVQGNPMIGNSPVDLITAEQGVWLTGSAPMGSGELLWDATVSTPSFFSDFSEDAGHNYKINLTYAAKNGFGFGFGVFQTTGDAQCVSGMCTLADGGAVGSLIGLGDGDNYEFSTGGPDSRTTHVAIVPGIDATIVQADAQYKNEKLMLHAQFGVAQDEYSFLDRFGTTKFSEQDAEMRFATVTGQYIVSDSLYLAGRYSISQNESHGVAGKDNVLDRIQLGVGYRLIKPVLLKAEYVKQWEEANSGGLKTNGLGEAQWDGFSLEISIQF